MENLLAILIGAIFVNNFVLARFLGICPFIGVSRSWRPALGMGLAVTLVMALSSFAGWLIESLLLVPFNLQYLRIISFILVIACAVQLTEMFIKRYSQPLYNALGIYLPLITTNCAVLGVALLNVQKSFGLIESLVNGIGGGIGFALALMLMSAIRERLDLDNVPKSFAGVAIVFVTAALMSMAFLAFSGMMR
ncbi:MAG: electron transport complex subunit RsxA [Candidatus Woesearchaeota archaeon]